jgi:recombination protein RecT
MSNIKLATPNVVRASLANEAMQKQLSAMITDVKKRNMMASSMVAMVQQTPTLQECEVSSLFNASLAGAAIDLPYGFGYWYAIPFNNKKVGHKQAQFQMGYKGLIQLALRSGQYSKIVVAEIKEGEVLDINDLTETYRFKQLSFEKRKNAKTIGYYAMFILSNGFLKETYWEYDRVLEHADTYSQAFKRTDYIKLQNNQIPQKDLWKYSSFWYKNFDEMAKKTVLKSLLSKWGILSVEMQSAVQQDQAVYNSDGSSDYSDNPKNDFTADYKVIEQKDVPSSEVNFDDLI